jgi:hypothetical protein
MILEKSESTAPVEISRVCQQRQPMPRGNRGSVSAFGDYKGDRRRRKGLHNALEPTASHHHASGQRTVTAVKWKITPRSETTG